MQRVADASADSLLTFVQHAVQPGSVVITDGLQSYRRLPKRGYRHDRRVLLGRGESAEAVLPRVHRVASPLKRWLLGTHQGGVSREHLDYYLDEFTFRFNRRTSRHRGKLFHRLLEQAVAVGPVPYAGDGQGYPWSEEETPPQPVVGDLSKGNTPMPERGEKPSSVHRRLWRVVRIRRTDEARVADLVQDQAPEAERQTASRAVDDLVVVAEFRDPIYPGLVSTGKVERGGDRPCHTVINAENFHALQVLLYTHQGKVDAIYIDPPYNTGGAGLEVQQRLR